MSDGAHHIWVRGRDAAGNWGDAVETILTVDTVGPVIGPLTVTPNPTAGAPQATLTGTIADDPTGIAPEPSTSSAPTPASATARRDQPGRRTARSSATIDTSALPEGTNRLDGPDPRRHWQPPHSG